jgi:glycosyltransferase involved in cell wall biosynthesis
MPDMKICYYNHTGKVSGAEKVLFTLVANLGPGFEPSLIAPETPQVRAFCQEHGIRHLPVNELRARFTVNPFLLLKYVGSAVHGILQVRRLVRQVAPDVLHANSTRAGMVASLATMGSKTPLVWHVHDQFKKHPITKAVGFLLRSSARNSVIAVSHATAQSVRGSIGIDGVNQPPVTVIYNSVDGPLYAPRPEAVAKFLEAEKLQDATFRVVMVGLITPRKGQLETIENFAKFVASDAPGAQLLIVGSPVFNNDELYLQRLKTEVKRLGMESNVRFMGHRTDIPVILQSSQLLVSNSSSEPFGLAALEASASGTAVLASAVDGVPEVVRDGVTGKLFPHGDSDAMLKALRQLHGDRDYARSLGVAGRERALRYFSQEEFIQQFRQFYVNLFPATANASTSEGKQTLPYHLHGYEQANHWSGHDA